MKINSIGPNFRGNGDVVIKYKDGKNAKNPYINNTIMRVLERMRLEDNTTTVVFETNQINISSPPKRLLEALAETKLVCRMRVGKKLKLIK